MADVFISYAHNDREKVERLAEKLVGEGHTVWWDRQLVGGAEFAKNIEQELANAKVIIAAWSKDGSKSRWVKDEASIAADAAKLVTVSLDGADPPIGFRQFHCIDLSTWRDRDDGSIAEVVRAVQAIITGDAPPAPSASLETTDKKFVRLMRSASSHRGIVIGASVVVALFLSSFLFFRGGAPDQLAATAPQNEQAPANDANSSQPSIPQKSVAVLAFDDFSPNGDQEWFANGLSEEIINSLAQLPEITVAARTSSFSFKNQAATHSVISKTLNVAHLLEGSVRRDGDRIRITAQLIRADDGVHLWSHAYDGAIEDVFDLQQNIAENVAHALNVVLDDDRRDAMRQFGTRNIDAYEYHLRGIDFFNKAHDFGGPNPLSTLNLLWRANDWFDKAIQADPSFSAPHFLRADAFTHFILYEGVDEAPPDLTAEDALIQARQTYKRAAELATDESSRLIFQIHYEFYSYNWAAVSQLLDEIDFDEATFKSLTALDDIPEIQIAFGRGKDALQLLEAIIERDPVNEIARNLATFAEWAAFGPEAGIARIRAEREMKLLDEQELYIREVFMLLELGRADEAVALSAKLDTTIPYFGYTRAAALALDGQRDEAEELVDSLIADEIGAKGKNFAFRAMGRFAEAKQHVLEWDAAPGAPTVFAKIVATGGGKLVYPPSWTPNYTALLDSVGVDLELRTIPGMPVDDTDRQQ